MILIVTKNTCDAVALLDKQIDRNNSKFNHFLRRELIDRENGIIFLALLQERIVGIVKLILIHSNHNLADGKLNAHLGSLQVNEHYRRKGIAIHLIREVELKAIERGFKRLTIMVKLDNKPALNLYQKMGFILFERSMW